MRQDLPTGYNNFDRDLGVLPTFENVNLAYNYKTMSGRVFIFHMSILWDKIYPWV